MLKIEDSVLVLLAAGRSTRFAGDASKLAQPVDGLPLGLHAARALATLPFRRLVAVTGAAALPYDAHGFEMLANPDPARGLAGSVRLGVGRAEAIGAASVVIALADMPRVTAAHVRRLFAASADPRSIAASSDGRRAMPPALFGAARFAELMALDGDTGARDLIRTGHRVVAPADELIDVDTRDDLAAVRGLVRSLG